MEVVHFKYGRISPPKNFQHLQEKQAPREQISRRCFSEDHSWRANRAQSHSVMASRYAIRRVRELNVLYMRSMWVITRSVCQQGLVLQCQEIGYRTPSAAHQPTANAHAPKIVLKRNLPKRRSVGRTIRGLEDAFVISWFLTLTPRDMPTPAKKARIL